MTQAGIGGGRERKVTSIEVSGRSEKELVNRSNVIWRKPMTTDQESIGMELLPGVVLKLTRVILLVPVIAEGELLECSWSAKDTQHLAMPRTILHSKELSCSLCDLTSPLLIHVDEKPVYIYLSLESISYINIKYLSHSLRYIKFS